MLANLFKRYLKFLHYLHQKLLQVTLLFSWPLLFFFFVLLLLSFSLSLCVIFFFFFNDTATTEIYTLSLHDALPISLRFSKQIHIYSIWIIFIANGNFCSLRSFLKSGPPFDCSKRVYCCRGLKTLEVYPKKWDLLFCRFYCRWLVGWALRQKKKTNFLSLRKKDWCTTVEQNGVGQEDALGIITILVGDHLGVKLI